MTNKYFNINYTDTIAFVQFNYMFFLENESYSYKEDLIELLDEIDASAKIKVLVLSNDHPDYSFEQYKIKWNSFFTDKDYENNILRVFRTFDELFIKIKSLKKVVLSVNTKSINASLFNFSMVADLRFISDQFFIDNDNENMLNIPKGGAIYNESNISFRNPIKLLFLLEKITAETLYKRQLVDKVYSEKKMSKINTVAKRLSLFEYIELEAVKILEQKNIKSIERSLQQENEFLLSCIRTKVNQSKK